MEGYTRISQFRVEEHTHHINVERCRDVFRTGHEVAAEFQICSEF